MSTQPKDDILLLGETFVTLLKSPICPPEVRAAIIQYLDKVRKQLDMTNPELVLSVFNFLATTAQLPSTEAVTQAQGQAISTVLAAASKTGELPELPATQPTGELAPPEPKVMAAAAPTTAQPVMHSVPVGAPSTVDPARNTGRNLASRLVEDRE
ncbi:MAG: hypothetical protein HOP19_02960 [Acidobacteria bacterium]|nr:hypothetical protein [Acidobacteriota bacterium]